MYIYIYVYIYIFICIYIYIDVSVYIYIFVHAHVCMYVYIYSYIYILIYTHTQNSIFVSTLPLSFHTFVAPSPRSAPLGHNRIASAADVRFFLRIAHHLEKQGDV